MTLLVHDRRAGPGLLAQSPEPRSRVAVPTHANPKENMSAALEKFAPVEDRVVLKVVEEAAETRPGSVIIVPESAREKPQLGEVIAAGPGRYEQGHLVPMPVKPGDRVLYGKYSGSEVTFNGETFLVLRASDLFLVFTDA